MIQAKNIYSFIIVIMVFFKARIFGICVWVNADKLDLWLPFMNS